MATYEPWSAERASEIIDEHKALEGAAMPILHALQETFGYIPQDAEPLIAKALNISRAEVHGVFTFYHDFRHKPAGKHVLKLCAAEACQSMGADALMAHAEQRLGCGAHGTSADGRFTLEPVYCLGLCASSPAIQVGEKLHARVTADRFDAVIAKEAAQ